MVQEGAWAKAVKCATGIRNESKKFPTPKSPSNGTFFYINYRVRQQKLQNVTGEMKLDLVKLYMGIEL